MRMERAMLEASYGKEPFDLRLTVLRMMRQWKKILFITLAGTLLFGGGYCVRNILLRGETQYRATSVYRMDYSVDDTQYSFVTINGYTWDTYLHTKEFLDLVQGKLAGGDWDKMSNDELSGYIRGDIESDCRVPSTIVTTEDAEKTTALTRAVEEALVRDFSSVIGEIKSIRVMDPGEAGRVIPDLRVGRAFILGAVLAFFFTVIVLLLRELGDDSIWLPATLRQRYGLQAVGTAASGNLKENICYLFRETSRVAVCAAQEDCDPAETAEAVRKVCAGTTAQGIEWIPMPSPLICPESAERLRETGGILLAVKAGAHSGKQTEYVMEYLAQQDCKITAVILTGADESLIRRYYGFRSRGKERAEGV